MKLKGLLICAIFWANLYPIWNLHADTRGLISEDVALFIPEGLQMEISFFPALLKEPVILNPLPEEWDLIPSFFDDSNKFHAILSIPQNIDLYGTGEVTGPLRRNGHTISLWNTDNYGYTRDEGKNLYQSHPWVLGVRPDGSSFGIIFLTSWRAELKTLDESVSLESEGPAFPVIIIEKPNPKEVLKELSRLTGTASLPPVWALGFHQCKYSYYPDSEVRKIADRYRSLEIPCDVIWVDIDYMDDFKIFTFDPQGFPDPAATNSYLHDRGFHSVWMINPGVKIESGYFVYEDGTENNYWVQNDSFTPYNGRVWPGDCVFPDFTMPEVRQWWAGLYREFMSTGIDGVWNDMNEPSVFNGPNGTMPTSNIHRGGGNLPSGSHLRYHNLYGMLMTMASKEGILAANPDKRPFVLTRSNFIGGQRFAATWTGDNRASWDHFKMSIPMSLNLGLSGQPLSGADIGGFIGRPTSELYAHWISVGAFYPFSRAHADNISGGNEPWSFGSVAANVSRTAISRRYRLLPYIYTQMETASRTGIPIMMPVFFHDEIDLSLRSEEEAFLFGEDLLVIPLWAESPAIPSGIWRDLHLLPEDLEDDGFQPQLKIRPGAIIPCTKVQMHTDGAWWDSLTLQISLDENGEARGSLYSDEGDGFEYIEGEYLFNSFHAKLLSDSISVVIDSESGQSPSQDQKMIARVHTDKGVLRAYGNLQQELYISLDLPISLQPGMQGYHPALGVYWGLSENAPNWYYSDILGFCWLKHFPWIWSPKEQTWLHAVDRKADETNVIWFYSPNLNDNDLGNWLLELEEVHRSSSKNGGG